MALFIFECPCCGERHVLQLSAVYELPVNVNVDMEDWQAFLRVANKIQPKFQESEKFKKWQEGMA